MWNRNRSGIKRIAENQASKYVNSVLLDTSFQNVESRKPAGWSPKRLRPSLTKAKSTVKRPLYKSDGSLHDSYVESELFGHGGMIVRVLLWRRYLEEITRRVNAHIIFCFRGFLRGSNLWTMTF